MKEAYGNKYIFVYYGKLVELVELQNSNNKQNCILGES